MLWNDLSITETVDSVENMKVSIFGDWFDWILCRRFIHTRTVRSEETLRSSQLLIAVMTSLVRSNQDQISGRWVGFLFHILHSAV